jgi:hypothetical protein
MDALLARYFDGDLDEREAREFLDRVEAEPELEKELRAYERLFAVAKSFPAPGAPEGFTRRVMASVGAEDRPTIIRQTRTNFNARWAGLAVAAAVAVLAYVGGWWSGTNQTFAPPGQNAEPNTTEAAAPVAVTSLVNRTTTVDAGYQYVRFAYVPTSPDVDRVTIAGSFNNWDPDTTPLVRQNGAWSTILVLPPGSYEYMFVEDGERWITDPLAAQTRDDGFGGANAVIDVEL